MSPSVLIATFRMCIGSSLGTCNPRIQTEEDYEAATEAGRSHLVEQKHIPIGYSGLLLSSNKHTQTTAQLSQQS